MGRHNAVVLYRLQILGAYLVLPITLLGADTSLWPLIGLASAPLAIPPLRTMSNRTGAALNEALAGTGALLGAFSLLVSAGLLLAS
jgi:1,4-dihydroxy-2-naphthoate octaprenyltransferase